MDLSKILLVLKREYLTKVRTKSFIISTLLTPLTFIAFIAIMVFVTISDSEVQKTIAIVDHTGVLYPRLAELDKTRYTDAGSVPIDTLKAQVLGGKIDGYIILDDGLLNDNKSPQLVHGGSGGMALQESIRSEIRDAVREERLSRKDVPADVREIFELRPGLDAIKLTAQGEKADNTIFASAFGFILGLLIFIGILGYGAMLMQSVMEEKTNRIVEVIASSIKPIELLFGKLFGVCLLALTQFGLWIVTYIGLSVLAAPVTGMILASQMKNIPAGATEIATSGFDAAMLNQFVVDPVIFVYFFMFFILGFLIYSSVFAAIGSAVETQQDTQQFMLPVMVPIFIGYFLNLKIMESPDSTIALVASLFPLTSPINMITRIAITEVPFWQIATSILLMIGCFFGVMWIGARIYSVGILMYGKKPSWKELGKWLKMK